jgi:hypothetical protein
MRGKQRDAQAKGSNGQRQQGKRLQALRGQRDQRDGQIERISTSLDR